jgi:NAD(P)-dependent dehydrogenase (short-subunit alcohol dehydrogenase family)
MKVALVTGGSSGIGKEIVLCLIRNNYNVAVTGRSMDKLLQAYKDVGMERLHFIETDVMQIDKYKDVVYSVVEHFGYIDLLVNNVGGGKFGETIEKTTVEDWNEMMTLNLSSGYFMTQAALTCMTPDACVINFSSILASRPVNGLAPYSIAKSGVEMMTKSLALELAPKKIRVLCISPATIQTNFHTGAGMSQEAADKYYEGSAGTHPIGRIGQPSDISELVVFLADNSKAGFMTGSVIHVDGGRMLTSSAIKL